MGIVLDYSFKYYVRLYSQPIIDLVIYFGLPEDVKPFYCVHHSEANELMISGTVANCLENFEKPTIIIRA